MDRKNVALDASVYTEVKRLARGLDVPICQLVSAGVVMSLTEAQIDLDVSLTMDEELFVQEIEIKDADMPELKGLGPVEAPESERVSVAIDARLYEIVQRIKRIAEIERSERVTIVSFVRRGVWLFFKHYAEHYTPEELEKFKAPRP